MAQLTVEIGNFSYKLACRDGEEERLAKLASYVDAKVADLSKALGQVTENRMLLMAALLIADELFEVRDAVGDESSDTQGSDVEELGAFLAAAAQRAEQMTARLEAEPQNP